MSMPSNVACTPNFALSRERVGDLGRVQQRLGRDAAAVQAGAADLVLLDQGDALAELGRAQRAGVAAAAAAEDDDVVRPPSATVHSFSAYAQCRIMSLRLLTPGCQPEVARRPSSAAIATSVRTAAPVPPFGV